MVVMHVQCTEAGLEGGTCGLVCVLVLWFGCGCCAGVNLSDGGNTCESNLTCGNALDAGGRGAGGAAGSC